MAEDSEINRSELPPWRLYTCVFLCGAAVMALELSGSRVLAPFLGTSIYVWTSLIGIVLAALSVGYAWGGRIADTRPESALFSKIILLAGMLTASVAVLQFPLLYFINSFDLDMRISAVLAAVVLFAAPSLVLGMVMPFAVRLTLSNVASSGKEAGRLYAISTLGSIMGTFLAGFLLIAVLGTSNIFLFLGALLIVSSCVADPLAHLVLKILCSLVLCLLLYLLSDFQQSLVDSGMRDFDTQYQRVLVLDTKDEKANKRIRYLLTDPLGSQSAMDLEDPTRLVGEYGRFYLLARHFRRPCTKVLLLGGGAFSIPKYFLERFPEMEMDVVELDPGITELARKSFNLHDSPRMRIFHEDARTYLARTTERYDAIFFDVFASSPSVPFQLSTLEAAQDLRRVLRDGGVLLANVISAIEGDSGRYLRAQLRTWRDVFSEVLLFPTLDISDGARVQNLMLIATTSTDVASLRSEDAELQTMLDHLWRRAVRSDLPVLRDDFAPVEHYMLPTFLSMHAASPGKDSPLLH